MKAVHFGTGLPLLDDLSRGGGGGSHYCLVGSVEWGDHCWKTDTGSLKRVSGSEGITDVEGRMLRDKVVIVLGLVLVEG